jgi:hypothetical protein
LTTSRAWALPAACEPGTDVIIFNIVSPKNLAKILAFFSQTTASFCKKIDHNIGFGEKRLFSPKIGENFRKL